MEAAVAQNRCSRVDERRLTPLEIATRIARINAVLPELFERLSSCSLCPRCCGARRLDGEVGECGLSGGLRVASVALHRGEEPPISGDSGAINVFFSGCNLHCLHCQNWPISQLHVGRDLGTEDLTLRVLQKWRRGAHALGWVTPTPQIVGALRAYRGCLEEGFDLPLIHNNGGYEDPDIIRLLSGIVDIWLPDAKTADSARGQAIQSIPDYPRRNLEVIAAMVEQTQKGEARAVIVRHLVLPGGFEDSKMVLKKLMNAFGSRIHLSLMMQYFPAFHASDCDGLNRRLTESEYESITQYAWELGFRKGWVQNYEWQNGIQLCGLS